MIFKEKTQSDQEQLVQLLDGLNLPYQVFDHVGFIADEAIKHGAVTSVSIRDFVDVAFDKSGNIVGSFTHQVGSFIHIDNSKC